MHSYRIGKLNIRLEGGRIPLEEDRWMQPFAISRGDPDLLYRLEKVDFSPFDSAKSIQNSAVHELLEIEAGLFVMSHWANCRYGYGFRLRELYEKNTVTVYANSRLSPEATFPISRILSTLGLHGKFLQRGAGVLHASYIDYRGSAILFAAPSQTGKSTQASLWEQFAGAEIINGDRALVEKREGKWFAHGYPCCGSSLICINRSLPLAAIVILRQGRENRVEELTPGEKLRALVSGTEVYPWYGEDVENALSFAQALTAEVPVIRLVCRPDEQAVTVLQQYLERYAHENNK